MNNVVKSVIFAAVILVAGIAAMQVIYNNVTGNQAEEAASLEPAAGETAPADVGATADEAAAPADALAGQQPDPACAADVAKSPEQEAACAAKSAQGTENPSAPELNAPQAEPSSGEAPAEGAETPAAE